MSPFVSTRPFNVLDEEYLAPKLSRDVKQYRFASLSAQGAHDTLSLQPHSNTNRSSTQWLCLTENSDEKQNKTNQKSPPYNLKKKGKILSRQLLITNTFHLCSL